MNYNTLDFFSWIKVGQIFHNLFIGSNRVIVFLESSIVRSDVYLFVQDSTILLQWSVTLCSSTRLLIPLLLNFSSLEVTSQYVLLHRHNISEHLESSLKRPGYLLSCCLHFTQHVHRKKLLQRQLGNYQHSQLTPTSAIPLSFQVWYNLPVSSRQKLETSNLCPFLTLRTCLHHIIWWRKCSTAPTFAVLRIEERKTRQWLALCVQSVLLWVQLQIMHCSCNLTFWTVYHW